MDVQHIDFALDQLYKISRIPARFLIKAGHHIVIAKGFPQAEDPLFLSDTLRGRLVAIAGEAGGPVLEDEDEKIAYGTFLDGEGNCVILGPVCHAALSAEELKVYRARHHLPGHFTLQHVGMQAVLSSLVLAYHTLTGQAVDPGDVRQATTPIDGVGEYAMEFHVSRQANTESGSQSQSYAQELESYRAIREGDPDAILRRIPEGMLENLSRHAQSETKHYEYLVCSAIALATRAAMQGGLNQEFAYSLEQLGKHRLERCTTTPEMIKLLRDTMVGFAGCVKEHKRTSAAPSYIDRCRGYIDNHLSTPFVLADIADELGIHPAYLSRRFTKEMGIGIKQYTLKARLEAASNMLTFSTTDISTIASYLCFPSQSYFGQVFKKHFGTTPQKYRDHSNRYVRGE